jgi:hypothetical protein
VRAGGFGQAPRQGRVLRGSLLERVVQHRSVAAIETIAHLSIIGVKDLTRLNSKECIKGFGHSGTLFASALDVPRARCFPAR